MVAMLLAYDAGGAVIATLDHLVARDDAGNVIGLVDFEAHELAGGRLRDIWNDPKAVGSGTWPEWLGSRAHEFRIERGPDGRIAALVHRISGHRRERADIEAAIEARKAATPEGKPVDLRDLVGGPQRPIAMDDEGRAMPRVKAATPAHLPIIGRPG